MEFDDKKNEYRSVNILTILLRSWRIIFGVLVPIILSPLLLDPDNKVNRCAYVLILMVLFWMFEPINLYITALVPVALFPLLNIADTEKVSQNYMKAANMMFLGGLIIGISLEHCNLHQRIALKVIILFGSSMKFLMAGVMIVTMFLSMWINNTATTAMMIPIVDGILDEMNVSLKQQKENDVNEDSNSSTITDGICNGQQKEETSTSMIVVVDKEKKKPQSKFEFKDARKAFLLSIAYSANIGGTATLTGTGTNLVFQDVVHNRFGDIHDVSFASWFFYAFPSALLSVIAAWLLLYILYVRIPNESNETGKHIKMIAMKKYKQLGPMTFHEIGVAINFVIIVLLWFLRHPYIFEGWESLITKDPKFNIKDGTPAILIVLFLFLIPANLHQFYSKEKPKQIERLLNWKIVKQKMSWGVFILLGGGFALADGTQESKLNDWFSLRLESFELKKFEMMIVLVIVSASITEMASNVATASVILPVVGELAVRMDVNPLFFMVPITICISFAFMFPVSTPPNAIVFEYLDISIIEMVKPGIFMNIIAITIQLIFINTFGLWLFNLNHFPDWAKEQNSNATFYC